MYVFSSFILVALSLAFYSALFRFFIGAYSAARSADYLVWVLYLPSLVVVSATSMGFMLVICGLMQECSMQGYYSYFLRVYRPVLFTGGVGAVLGLFMGEATRTAARLFVVDLFIAAVYVVLVLYWFVIRLPLLLASVMGEDAGRLRAILYWVLAVLVGGWGLLPVRLLVLELLPSLNDYMFYEQLTDPLLDKMLRKYLLRYVDAVFFPLFVIVSSYTYYYLLRKRR